MRLIERLNDSWSGLNYPFLIYENTKLRYCDIAKQKTVDLDGINSGDVVALIGDFDPQTVSTLLKLMDKGVILVPLTVATRTQHQYFFETALVDVIIEGNHIQRLRHHNKNPLIEMLKSNNRAGLVLFSTGTTGYPKAILHDLTLFLKRFETPRLAFRTINFLLFDHIGGLNTLLHTLFNKGAIIAPAKRTVENILRICKEQEAEVLPTTPTFLRMMLMSGLIPHKVPKSLKIITYGTERMDQRTLSKLCTLLPNIDFRQTFGMSELGILRVKSKARDSLWVKIGGKGVETRIVKNILEVRSQTKMLGYLNAPSPFDQDGWYHTKDIVEEQNGYYKITGRVSDVINVGGLKFMPSEVEQVALQYDNVVFVKAIGKENPLTGQHVELTVQPKNGLTIDKTAITKFLRQTLQAHMMPKRIIIGPVTVGHRFKRN